MSENLNKIELYLQKIDQELTLEHTAKWGLMNAQNMVEHLSLSFMLSTGKWGKEFNGDEARAAKMKANFFAVKYPFPKSVAMPGSEQGKVPPLRCKTIAESKDMLRQSVLHFKEHYQANPTDKVQHPYFGLLTFEEWTNFHLRHLEHHLMQFGVLPYPLTSEMEANLKLIEEKLQKVYNDLTIDHQAKWGMMNAHNMVEHLSMVFLYSTGKFGIPFKGEETTARLMWLPFKLHANPWKTVFPQKNFTKAPPKLRTENIEAAKKALKKAFIKYKHYCMENPDAITPHGFLGNITTAQWLQVHVKHIDHHLSQFGVIEELV